MQTTLRHFILLHFIVFIWGWTAVLGKLITLPALQLTWIRVMLALVGMLVYVWYRKIKLKTTPATFFKLLGIGFVVGLHWMCFYGAVKVSNVAVTLACFSAGTLFTSLMEPLFFKRKVLWYELIFGIIVIGALLLIFNLETHYALGMLLGVLAALTSSFMAVSNSLVSRKNLSAGMISVYEMIGCLACISIFTFFKDPAQATFSGISTHDWIWLIVLGIGCTTLPFIIGVSILKNISPYTMSLTLNLETIYGILFAWLIFSDSEVMSGGFYAGTAIILGVVVADTYMKKYVKS